MKSIFMLAIFVALSMVTMFGESAHASLSNANAPYTLQIPLGSPTADATSVLGHFSKRQQIKSLFVMNNAALGASDTNYAIVQVKNGSSVIASLDTRAAAQNGLADKVAKSMVISGDGSVAAASDLTIVYDETDTGSNVQLTGAVLSIELYPY